jgi:excisionase family DNA binding protein
MLENTARHLQSEKAPSATPTLLLTISQTSAAMNLSRGMVYKLIASGQLESILSGRARRIPLRSIERFISDQLGEDVAK